MAEHVHETEPVLEAAVAAEEEVVVFPASFSQQRLWFIDRLEPGSPAYNVPMACRISGPLDVEALERSIGEIIRRHEVLRTALPLVDDAPAQVIAPPSRFSLDVEALDEDPPADRTDRLRDALRAAARQPFDLASGPLMRARLWRLAEGEHALLFVLHHIISDGWSMRVLVRELAALYDAFAAGRPSPLPALPIQYADYTVWQQERWQSGALDEQLAYWMRRLDGITPLELPTDHPRPPAQTFRGATHRFALPAGVMEALKKLAQREGATLFMALLAAFKTLLYRYTGRTDVSVGSPVAGRLQREVEPLIGFFVNTLVLRTELPEDASFREALGHVRQTALEAYEHQELPFGKLVEALQPERDAARTPLVQLLFALENEPAEHALGPDLRSEPMSIPTGTAKFDLTFVVENAAEGCTGRIGYSTDLFDAVTIERLAGHFCALLEAIAASPDQPIPDLPLLVEEERHQVLTAWNRTGTVYPKEQSVHALFAAQARQTPEAVAIAHGEQRITYAELDARANKLARHLRAHGAGSGAPVALLMDRSPEMVVGMLAVLKAGGAYVPLDPAHPAERLAFMLEDAGAEVLLAQPRWSDLLAETDLEARLTRIDVSDEAVSQQRADALEDSDSEPESLAYVIYTSGSTGTPKGVAVPHRAIVRLVKETDYAQLTPADVVAHASNASFDAATFEVWGALLNGATLAIFDQEVVLSPKRFAASLQARGVSTLFLTTALFNLMAREAPGAFASLRHVLFGGEAVDPRWVRAVLRDGPPERLLHVYGPTESTTFATWQRVEAVPEEAATVPIGRPIANTRCYVLDKRRQPVPVGVEGELYLGGDGLARGYLGRPALTAEKFVANPFAQDERLYKTGDLVRWRPDGALAFIGRADRQVKLRGFRIEPGEIEAALNDHSGIKESVVVVRGGASHEKQLVAYIVPDGEAPSASSLRAQLKGRLPAYMVPSAFVEIEELPLTPNGKVDRKALPAPDAAARPEQDLVAPRTPAEKQLAEICSTVLGLQRLGVHDNLFEAGANSLRVVVISSRAAEVGLPLTPRQFLEHQTIADLAAAVRPPRASDAEPPAPSRAGAGGDPAPQTEDGALVPIRPNGAKAPFFFAGVFLLQKLAPHLDLDRPLYGLMRRDLDTGAEEPEQQVKATAARYVAEIRALQPEGPYYLGGFCFGGIVAFEMAQQLRVQGCDVALLAMIETRNPQARRPAPTPNTRPSRWEKHGERLRERGPIYLAEWASERLRHELERRKEQARRWIGQACLRAGWPVPLSLRSALTLDADGAAMQQYVPERYPGRITLLWGREEGASDEAAARAALRERARGWGEIAAGGVRAVEVSAEGHTKLFEEPHVRVLAERIEACFEEAPVHAET